MRLITNSIDDGSEFYLPHHAVIKDTLTTKLRVVFDGSATLHNGVSLNNILSVGPTVQDDLFSILLRFRTNKYALSADISKMYQQIINPEQYKVQRILWREHKNNPLQIIELITVTYGISCAPYIATRCLNHLANIEQINFKFGSKILKTTSMFENYKKKGSHWTKRKNKIYIAVFICLSTKTVYIEQIFEM